MADRKIYLEQYDDGNPNLKSSLNKKQLKELIPLIGSISVLFNGLETDLERQIAQFINERTYQPGYAVVTELTPVFTKKVSVFKALYGPLVGFSKNKKFKKDFESVWKALYAVKDIRNEVAHADWLNGSGTYEIRLKLNSDENGAYAITRVMTPDYLRAKSNEIEKAAMELERFEESFSNFLQGIGE